MKTKVIKKTKENHNFVTSLYQVSKCEVRDRTDYDLEILDKNGVKFYNKVECVDFDQESPLVHSIFIVEMQNDFLPTQLIFTY